MASALKEREEKSSKCLICNVKVTTRSSYDIYCTLMPQRENLLIDVMSRILKKVFDASQMRSSVLCRRCFTLFDELDQISTRFKKLQTDIIKRYTSTCIEYKDDTFINVVNSMTPTKIIKLPLSDQENENKFLDNEEKKCEKSSCTINEIVDTIINNIQAEETMANIEDNLNESSASNNSKEEVESTNEGDKELIDDTVDNSQVSEFTDDTLNNPQVIISLPDIVEQPLCETKLRKRSGTISYNCEECEETFWRASDLKSHHTTVHQTSKRFVCLSCDKSYSTKQSLNNHQAKEHKPLDNEMDDSIKTTTDVSQCGSDSNLEANADYTNDSSESMLIKVKPDFSVENSMYSEEVIKQENDDDDFEWKEEQFNCNEENIVEDSSSAIDETIAPSSGSEKSGKRQIKKERKKKGSSRSGERACLPAIHSCGLCGKKWRTVTELKSHIQSHSSIRPYVCEICGQAYKMKKALDVHIGMHNGIHPFTCEYCNKSFTQKVGLQKHIPIHTGYTRFQCHLCGKRFIHQKSFHIHTMTHTGEKHVKCSECGLAVLSQSHLKRHLRVHTGERPYACPICGKRFAEKYNMNAHVHIHDNAGNGPRRNRIHICQLCGMSYDRKHKLEYHLASTHNKIDSKFPQDQETVQQQQQQQLQPKSEYFQENSQGHQIITVDNNAIEHNGSTAMITVSGVKVPISLDGAPIMVTTLPQQSQTTNLVPLNIPAGSILAYTPTSSNDNNQQLTDGTQNVYMPQNPVTIQLS